MKLILETEGDVTMNLLNNRLHKTFHFDGCITRSLNPQLQLFIIHSAWIIRYSFFYTQFKSFYKDELPKTLLTTHFTILQRRYPEEHNNLTTLTPFHKRHRTKLKLNIRLQKATYNQFTDNWHRIKEACFAVDVELTNSKKKILKNDTLSQC